MFLELFKRMIVTVVHMGILLQYIGMQSIFFWSCFGKWNDFKWQNLARFSKNMNYSFMVLLWSYLACLVIDL